MAMLCELARSPGDFDRFVRVVEAHGGRLKGRWKHCLGATNDLDPELLYRVLAALEVRTVEVRSETSRDSIELINRLADVWIPRSHDRAMSLGNALFTLVTDKGPTAGMIDMSSLLTRLGTCLPSTLGATTRRARLGRRRDGEHQRTALAMKAIGLEDEEAEMLATRALETPPTTPITETLTVVSGAMGVGKTTELERIHRVAIDAMLEDPNAQIPVFLRATEVGTSPLLTAASGQTEGLGDPSRTGVHLIIDGLDEAGIQITDLTPRIATLQAEWPNSTVIVGTRPQTTPPGLETVLVEALTPDVAEALMEGIHPRVAIRKWLRQELSEVLCRPLFAIRFALDHRQGNLAGISHGQLIGSVGWQAMDDIGDTTDDAFELLVRLACSVVDSGGLTAGQCEKPSSHTGPGRPIPPPTSSPPSKLFSTTTPMATTALEPTASQYPSHPSPSASAASSSATNSHLTIRAPTGCYPTVVPSSKPTSNSTTVHPLPTSPPFTLLLWYVGIGAGWSPRADSAPTPSQRGSLRLLPPAVARYLRLLTGISSLQAGARARTSLSTVFRRSQWTGMMRWKVRISR